jgi:excisionase family DNA binding protein
MSHTHVKERKPRAFVTVREAAETLDVSPETIRRRLDDGSLLGHRLGSVRRVAASELERLAPNGTR